MTLEFAGGGRDPLKTKLYFNLLDSASEESHLADYVLVELVGVLAHNGVVDVVVKRSPDLPHAAAIVRDGFMYQAGVTRGTGADNTGNGKHDRHIARRRAVSD